MNGNVLGALLALLLLPGGAFAATGEVDPWNCEAVPAAPFEASKHVKAPESGFASDSWVDEGFVGWSEERKRREKALNNYLCDDSEAAAAFYGFDEIRRPHGKRGKATVSRFTPREAWAFFDEHPIGYGGVPYVLLQTLLSIDPAEETDEDLKKLGRIWREPSLLADEQPEAPGQNGGRKHYTLDHLGIGPHPTDYEDGVAVAPMQRKRLPNGLVFDPTVVPGDVGLFANLLGLVKPDWRTATDNGWFMEQLVSFVRWLEAGAVRIRLYLLKWVPTAGLFVSKARSTAHSQVHHPKYDLDINTFQQAPKVDAVFFACTTCHQGRVVLDGEMDDDGRVTRTGRMHFMPGMPNTEIDAQYYSELLMDTGLALLESGFTRDSVGLPESQKAIKPKVALIEKLEVRMIERALDDETVQTIYGGDVERARLQTYHVASDFSGYVGDLIGLAIKTQYIYLQIAAGNAYAPQAGIQKPDVLRYRPGQMDAFGIAAGLIDIHTKREENSYLRYICRDNWQNPIFGLLGVTPGPECDRGQLQAAGAKIREQRERWVPPVPAPIDIPSLVWSSQRKLANWDGNQGADARTLASGTSATGDPLKVNVAIHQPLNTLIAAMPPAPYPFDVDREKARRGKQLFWDLDVEEGGKKTHCSECHQPNSAEIITPEHLGGVDENRAKVTTSEVGRYGMAALVKEACMIFVANSGDENRWCMPKHDDTGKTIETHDADLKVIPGGWKKSMEDYFQDTPARVRRGVAGYKAEMQHGIWARAPYLHNGSVPTLGHLICHQVRPEKFYRGNVFYDETMVGFRWDVPARINRYSAFDTQWTVPYDTSVDSRSNGGHTFGSHLCPDFEKLDIPFKPDLYLTDAEHRKRVDDAIAESDAGALIEYMKTF